MKLSLEIDVQVENGKLILSDQQGKVLTFSKEQVVQKKVSMVALGEMSDLPKLQIANAFGFATRKSYYDIRKQVLEGKPENLLPQKSGPQKPQKRTREVEALVIQMRFETDYNMYDIARVLKQKGYDVSPRLVAQILADYGISKKKR